MVLAAAASARECPSPLPVDQVRERLAAAEAAARPEERHEGLTAVLGGLGCAAGPLPPADVARVHRLVSLDAAWSGDAPRAAAAAAAAARIDPEGTTAAVASHPELAPPVTADLAMMSDEFGTSLAARVYVDGAEGSSRTVGQPAVVQVFDGAGRPIDGAWVAGDAPLPDWVAFPDLSCSTTTAVDGLLRHVAAAEAAYASLDVPAFERALEQVASGLPCVASRVGSTQAAAIHRLEGLRQFAHGGDDAALRSFQEARVLDPRFVPPPELVRPESALAALWTLAGAAGPGAWVDEEVPPGLLLTVDGLPSSARPSALPAIVQLSDPTGAVWWTRYVPPGARLPDFTAVGRAATERRAATLSPARMLYVDLGERRAANVRQTGLFAASGVAYSAGALAYLFNARAHSEYLDRDTPQPELDGLRRATNTSALVSTSAVAAGTALLVGAIVSR